MTQEQQEHYDRLNKRASDLMAEGVLTQKNIDVVNDSIRFIEYLVKLEDHGLLGGVQAGIIQMLVESRISQYLTSEQIKNVARHN